MPLKVSFNKEAHKLDKAPTTLQELRDAANSIYKETLPQSYRLEYTDNDGNRIVISDEQSFQDLLQFEIKEDRSVKVYIIPSDKGKTKKKSTGSVKHKKRTAPIIIENKEEFADDLAGNGNIIDRLEKGEAPTDESLPSSPDDFEEKVEEIKLAIKDLKEGGIVNLKPEFLVDSESEQEPGPFKKQKFEDGSESTSHVGADSEKGSEQPATTV